MKYAVGKGVNGNVETLHVSTNMSGKMKGIECLSTSCLVNPWCKANQKKEGTVCAHCYAQTTIKMYPALKRALEENYNILSSRLLTKKEASAVRFNSQVGRIEAFGDVASVVQARNYIRIMRANPSVKFGVWTKHAYLWDLAFKKEHGKPRNCQMVLSSTFLNDEEHTAIYSHGYKWVDSIFTVYEKAWLKANGKTVSEFINCGARDCMGCQKCYTKHKGVQYIHELLK